MRRLQEHRVAVPEPRKFYNVAEVARMFNMSDMTFYRAIQDGQFPAVRVRGRFAIPAKAIDEMIDFAVANNVVVDAASWVPTEGVPNAQP